MDSALRPRDIQARIRAGESAEAVAEAGKTTVDKVMPYAAPVLAERAHVAERAQRSSIRRRAGEAGSLGAGRTLQEAVAHHLRSMNVDPTGVEWDAYRREDGRWTLNGLFETETRSGVATFTFDMPGNYVTIGDDDARWLVGDVRPPAPEAQTESAPEALADPPAQRRLSAVRSESPKPLGDDAIEMVTSPNRAADTTPDFIRDLSFETTQELDLDGLAEQGSPAAGRTSPDATDEPAAETETTAPEPAPAPPARKTSKKRGRASVPSWDEIMFGGGTGE